MVMNPPCAAFVVFATTAYLTLVRHWHWHVLVRSTPHTLEGQGVILLILMVLAATAGGAGRVGLAAAVNVTRRHRGKAPWAPESFGPWSPRDELGWLLGAAGVLGCCWGLGWWGA